MRYSGSTQLLTQTGRDGKTSKKEEFFIAKLLIDVFIINYREVGGSGGLEVWSRGHLHRVHGGGARGSRRLVRRLQA